MSSKTTIVSNNMTSKTILSNNEKIMFKALGLDIQYDSTPFRLIYINAVLKVFTDDGNPKEISSENGLNEYTTAVHALRAAMRHFNNGGFRMNTNFERMISIK